MECLAPWSEGARGAPSRSLPGLRDAFDGWRRPQEGRRAFVNAARRAGLLRSR
ncbi:DUF982 domain-containing protein [Ensifer sp. MPMI2T]|nr:DUF982 domain-containing protein [Ensifer sp. MPMI2T]